MTVSQLNAVQTVYRVIRNHFYSYFFVLFIFTYAGVLLLKELMEEKKMSFCAVGENVCGYVCRASMR